MHPRKQEDPGEQPTANFTIIRGVRVYHRSDFLPADLTSVLLRPLATVARFGREPVGVATWDINKPESQRSLSRSTGDRSDLACAS